MPAASAPPCTRCRPRAHDKTIAKQQPSAYPDYFLAGLQECTFVYADYALDLDRSIAYPSLSRQTHFPPSIALFEKRQPLFAMAGCFRRKGISVR